MANTLVDPDSALAFLDAAPKRGITKQNLSDVIYSAYQVGGTLYYSDVDLPVTTAWAAFPAFEDSRDSKGLEEDIPNGRFTVGVGAAGTYKMVATIGLVSPAAGWVEIAAVRNGSLVGYNMPIDVDANRRTQIVIAGTGAVQEGDTIGLAIRASANATITGTHGQFTLAR